MSLYLTDNQKELLRKMVALKEVEGVPYPFCFGQGIKTRTGTIIIGAENFEFNFEDCQALIDAKLLRSNGSGSNNTYSITSLGFQLVKNDFNLAQPSAQQHKEMLIEPTMGKRYNWKNIRTMLTKGFTAEELRHLCYDEPNFRPVYDELAQDTGKTKIIGLLIEYGEQKLLIDVLLTLARQHNPARYEKHQPYYEATTRTTCFTNTIEKFHSTLIKLVRMNLWLFIVSIIIAGVGVFFLWNLLREPKKVFPHFGLGFLRYNSANIAIMERKLLPCEASCFEDVNKVLDIDAILEEGGYAVVSFNKLPLSKMDLGRQLRLRVSIETSDPDFEVGMWDEKSRRVFFNCHAQTIAQVSDFLINLDEENLTKNSVKFQPQHAYGFSIGFSHDAGSGPGRHHMKVYGISSGDSVDNLPQVSQCVIRRIDTKSELY